MSQPGIVHIVGAGLAGLSAAIYCARAGRQVVLYEAAANAGGRCRSYIDKDLNARIDNGNHLMLSCNDAALDYLHTVGAADTLAIADEAVLPFMDLQTAERWELKINKGRIPFWVFDEKARVPGTKWSDYLSALSLMRADKYAALDDKLDKNSVLYRRFWAPMTVAILNTQPSEGSARMLGDVFAEAFATGGKGCRPMMVKEGLSESFVAPALDYIKASGGSIHFGERLRSLDKAERITALHFANRSVEVGEADHVVLALPAWVVNDVLPELQTPKQFRSIVNAHFKTDVPKSKAGLIGLIGGTVDWVFEKDGIASTTTSAAEHIVDKSAEELAALLWRDVAKLYGKDENAVPAYRIVKEKRATFAATPEEIERRPNTELLHKNLVVCGDWTNTRLPSTIEGAIRSGRAAARVLHPREV